MQLAMQYYTEKKEVTKLALKTSDCIQIVPVQDIVYCQSDKGYTTFYLADKQQIVVSKVLKEYESLLPETQFVRCHQSYLVNSTYIKKYYKDGLLELTTGHTLPVSDRKREYVQDFFVEKLIGKLANCPTSSALIYPTSANIEILLFVTIYPILLPQEKPPLPL